jgi:hypothetical protein
MKFFKFILIFFVFLTYSLKAKEVTIIELHKNKSLDQLVLDSETKDEKTQENNNSQLKNEDTEKNNISLDSQDDFEQLNENNLNEVNIDDTANNKTIIILKTETIFDLDKYIIHEHFENIIDIKSKTLHREFINIISNPELENQTNINDEIYFIIKKLYELGEIGKAYTLIKSLDMKNISNQEYLNYFFLIELNYLFSTYKLSDVCELKTLLLEDSITLSKFLLEKTDIFCLTLENKLAEAKLLNSLLLDTEQEADVNFQKLFNFMISNEINDLKFGSLTEIKFKELIFLYSAMLRINELALDENFIDIDPLNLSIPVILSNATRMDIRIKAANKAFYDEVISIDSLSALYQSVDFTSKQFIKPKQTILSLNNNELIMAFYYQLANIQIFPDERLRVILDYWEFAKNIGLQKIAYAISKNIIDSFDPTSENTKFGMEIALAQISNKNYDEALRWLSIYENSDVEDVKIEYAKFLIDLNETNELDTIINYLSKNYINIGKSRDQKTLETIEVLMSFLNIEQASDLKLTYNILEDQRLMPSYSITRDINKNILANNELTFFILSLISINNKSWSQLHPEHLKLILNAFSLYDQGSLIKLIILEILNELEIF